MSDTPRDLTEFAGKLRSLSPLAGRLDRDQLMFRAGQASMPRPARFWPACTALLSATSLALLAVLALLPKPVPVELVVYVPASAPDVVASQTERPELEQPAAPRRGEGTTEESQYLRYRDQVIRWGPDALPRGGSTVGSPSSAGDLHQQLGMPPGELRRGTLIGGQAF